MVIEKSKVMARLKEIATVGFTFSIDELYSNPIQFIFKDYTHSEEVEENIALNTLEPLFTKP
jgi:hypothetical protein